MEKKKVSPLLLILLLPFLLGNVNDFTCSAIHINCLVNERYYATIADNYGTYYSFDNGVIGYKVYSLNQDTSVCSTIKIFSTSGSRTIYFLNNIESGILGVGAGGVIVRDDNGWVEINSPTTNDLYKFFRYSGTVIAVGAVGTIIISTDSGLNWELVNSPSSTLNLTDVYIDSYLSSFVQVVGEDLSMFQTFNGGVTWQKVDLTKPGSALSKTNNILPKINRIYHLDGLNGYIVGDSGTFIKTTDNFSTADNIEYIDLQTTENLNDIYFISPDSGVVVGDNGTIRFTTDGGGGWLEDPDLTVQLNGVNLKRISVYNNNIGTIMADSGLSITAARDSSFFTGVEDEPKPISSYSLSQNYPNPFNPSTKINYSIPKSGMVTIKIFDMLGQEILTLVDEEKPVGNYEIEFISSSLSSGVYFYQLKAGSFTDTKKLILLK